MTTKLTVPPELEDLLTPEALDDPYTYFGRYREISPVLWNSRWGGWIFTGHDEVRAALTDGLMTSERIKRFEGELTERSGGDAGGETVFRIMSRWLTYDDGAIHHRLRRVLSAPFMPGAVKRHQAETVEVVDQLIDRVELLSREGDVDLIREFASLVPSAVISRILGIPDNDVERLRHWSEELTLLVLGAFGAPDRHARARDAFVELEAYVRAAVDERRSQPRDDVLSAYTAAAFEDEAMTEDELISSVILIIFGGHETTTNLIGTSLLNLCRFPAARRQMLAGEVEPRLAIEEFLRFDGPVKAFFRDVAQDHVRQGQNLRKGDRALLVLGAANHDPEAFERPDDLDLKRGPSRHLSFGTGIHLCIGASLARMEAAAAIPAFLQRFPHFDLAAGYEPEWVPLIMSRGVARLPIVVGTDAS